MTLCTVLFACDKQWLSLEPTTLPTARFCGDCQKNVFMVKTAGQQSVAWALGRCVAISEDNSFVGVIGDPGAPGAIDWLEGEVHEVSLSLSAPVNGVRISALRRILPKVFDAGENEIAMQQGKPFRVGNFFLEDATDLVAELERIAPELSVSTRETQGVGSPKDTKP